MFRHLDAVHLCSCSPACPLLDPLSPHFLSLWRFAALLLPGDAACSLQETVARVQSGQHDLPPVAGTSDGAKT